MEFLKNILKLETRIIVIVIKRQDYLKKNENNIPFMTTFQSRFGPQQWLKPYTDITLQALPAKGIKKVLILCPGFASDCIETLEEIEIEAKDLFFESGGLKFKYVPCLNDNADHINLLHSLVKKYL